MAEKFDLMTIIEAACKLPMVRVDREKFLSEQFRASKYDDKRNTILREGTIYAGVTKQEIETIAKKCIKFETTKVTAISAAAGIPGGAAMLGTVSVDLVQFYAHVFRVMQELMYLYGWDDIGTMDDGTKNILIIFLGVMFGVNGAEKALGNICKCAANRAVKAIAAKALTKGTLYPIVKKIATTLGIKMTKDIFAKGVAKSIPVIGAVFSGGLTLATFRPMCGRLLRSMSENHF